MPAARKWTALILVGAFIAVSLGIEAQIPDPGQRLIRQKAKQRAAEIGQELQDSAKLDENDGTVDSGTTATEVSKEGTLADRSSSTTPTQTVTRYISSAPTTGTATVTGTTPASTPETRWDKPPATVPPQP